MDSNIAKMFDGPIPEKKPHPEAIKCLEDLLERARSGEIVGVMVASMCHDRLGQWDVAGETYGYSIVGAVEAGKVNLLKRLGEIGDS